MLSVSREPQPQSGATVQRSRSRLVRLLTSAKKTTPPTTENNERSTSPPANGSGLRARPSMKRPPAAASAFSKEHREAALRARGLLPPLPVKDLSQLEREQDSMIPVVSLPPLDEAPKSSEGTSSTTAADLIKKQWEAKNVEEETVQRQRLQSFKFGGASTTDLHASTSPSVGGDMSDPGVHSTGSQGLDLPNADKSASSSPLVDQRDLKQKDTHRLGLAGGDSQRGEAPRLPELLGAGGSQEDHYNATVTRNESFKTAATTSTTSSSIPPSLDNTSSRTLSSSSEELSALAYTRASAELDTTALPSSSPSIGGAGKPKGLPPILRVAPGDKDIPVIVENGEQEEEEDRGYRQPRGLAVAADEATVKGDSPRTLLPSQVLAAEAKSPRKDSTDTSDYDDDDVPPPVPPRDRQTPEHTSQLAFAEPKTLPATRKRGMTLDASASRSSSETANTGASTGNVPIVRRKTLNPFKRRGQKDRSVSPGRRDPNSPPTSTLGKIGRSVVGSVMRPSRQQTMPSSPRFQAQHGADDVPSFDQNSPPMPVPSSPRMGTAYSQSPPSSPSSKRGAGAYTGIFQQQQQRDPREDDAVVRQAVSPTFYSHGDIHAEASAIKDEEQRRVTEMAFLY